MAQNNVTSWMDCKVTCLVRNSSFLLVIMMKLLSVISLTVVSVNVSDTFRPTPNLFNRSIRSNSNGTMAVRNRTLLPQVKNAFISIGTVEGKLFYTNTNKMGLQWAEALDFCHDLGLHAASIDSAAQHVLVRNYLGKLPHRFFWLAGTDLFNEGNWHWLRTGKSFNYSKWAPGYPTKNRKLNCLYLSYGNNGWVDVSCSDAKLIIRPLCEKYS